MKHEQTLESARYLTVKQLAEHPRYPWLTVQALRHYIFASEVRDRFNRGKNPR